MTSPVPFPVHTYAPPHARGGTLSRAVHMIFYAPNIPCNSDPHLSQVPRMRWEPWRLWQWLWPRRRQRWRGACTGAAWIVANMLTIISWYGFLWIPILGYCCYGLKSCSSTLLCGAVLWIVAGGKSCIGHFCALCHEVSIGRWPYGCGMPSLEVMCFVEQL